MIWGSTSGARALGGALSESDVDGEGAGSPLCMGRNESVDVTVGQGW